MKIGKNTFYHNLAIISLVHVVAYDWFRFVMPQMRNWVKYLHSKFVHTSTVSPL